MRLVRPLVSLASLRRLAGYAGEVLGLPRAEVDSLLDPTPLRRTPPTWSPAESWTPSALRMSGQAGCRKLGKHLIGL